MPSFSAAAIIALEDLASSTLSVCVYTFSIILEPIFDWEGVTILEMSNGWRLAAILIILISSSAIWAGLIAPNLSNIANSCSYSATGRDLSSSFSELIWFISNCTGFLTFLPFFSSASLWATFSSTLSSCWFSESKSLNSEASTFYLSDLPVSCLIYSCLAWSASSTSVSCCFSLNSSSCCLW